MSRNPANGAVRDRVAIGRITMRSNASKGALLAPSVPPGEAPADLSGLIAGTEAGHPASAAALFAALYSELHRMAQRQLAGSSSQVTLGTTTLLHEAYLNMAGRAGGEFPDRGRFMGYAARVMRGLMIDYLRSRKAQKRGGLFQLAPLDEEVADPGVESAELTRIGDAIEELTTVDPDLAQVVDLRFFCGFSLGEIAAMRGLSERTVQRQWEKARLYLHRVLGHAASV
jgi:RNA polymerase sigma factor (TIGR02999 family)